MHHDHDVSGKFQIVMPDDLPVRLRRAAAAAGSGSVSQFIRESIEKRIEEVESTMPRMSLAERLMAFAGDAPETDLSSRVDEYLYGPDSVA